MFVKTTLGDAMLLLRAINDMAHRDVSDKLGFALAKTKKRLAATIAMHDEFNDKLIEEFAARDAAGNKVLEITGQTKLEGGRSSGYWKKYEEMLREPEEIEVHLVQQSEFSGLKLPSHIYEGLLLMIEEPEGAAPPEPPELTIVNMTAGNRAARRAGKAKEKAA